MNLPRICISSLGGATHSIKDYFCDRIALAFAWIARHRSSNASNGSASSTEKNIPRPDRLPIKLILPSQGKEKRSDGGGAPPKPFRTVDAAYRRSLANQVSAVREALLPQMRQTGAAPVRVKLLTKATAKSHRPEKLFSTQTCPIVGAGKLGELFVKATPDGLAKLTSTIEENRTERVMKELSCVESIEAVTPLYRRKGLDPRDVLRHSPRGKKGFMARVRLFNFGADEDQPRLVDNFETLCRKRKLRISTAGYSPGSFIYEAECRTVEDVEALSRVVGVRSIVSMPLIRTLRPMMLNPTPLPTLQARGDVVGDVPTVVVVDRGISDQIPALESWVVGRESQVAPEYRNTDHGTFVAGLICWGSALNPTIACIDSNPCWLAQAATSAKTWAAGSLASWLIVTRSLVRNICSLPHRELKSDGKKR